MKNPEQYWFGTESVTPDTKTEKVLGVFSSVASRYDLMNDVMSFGIHRLWKDRFVRLVASKPDMDILDMAGGTGDIAFRLHRATRGAARITVADINADMLNVGRDRAIDRGILSGLDWAQADAAQLPFDDGSFDIYTIAFGLRNVTRIDDALADAYRVLRPGGRFCCLEFSQVQDPVFDRLYQAFSTHIIPKMGAVIAGDRDSYQYLVDSIRKFPTQAQLSARLRDAGFDAVRVVNLTGGVAAIHIADKY